MPTRLPTAFVLLAAAALALAGGCSCTQDPTPRAMPSREAPAPFVGPHLPPGPDPVPTRLAGALAPAPEGLADVVHLLPEGVDRPGYADPLARELARQAMAMAAREDFGLRVTDASLGEPAPVGLPADRHLRVRGPEVGAKEPGIRWQVFAGSAGAEHQLWKGLGEFGFLNEYSSRPAFAVAVAENLSRTRLRDCLEAARFQPRPGRRSDAPVPVDAAALLREMRETAQFGAVRLLHQEVREKGESDALTAALARGYANLALLTEFHWSPAPIAFKARALLYAQRLVARSPDSAAARWARAYAAALVGLHRLALDDLAAAGKLAAADPPPWLEVLDAYLHFDLGRLAAARARADTPLTRLLQYLAAEQPMTPAATIRAGRAYLAGDPGCYRVHDGQCRTGGITHLHAATLAGPEAFAAHFAQQVRAVPGLPKPVAAVLAEDEPSEADLYAALRAAGDPSADRGEPTWAALAAVVQEVRFTQSWHRLYFMGHQWAVPTEEAAREVLPALAGHPLRPLIESFTLDWRRDPAGVRRLLTAAPIGEVDERGVGYYRRLKVVDPAAAQAWFGGALARMSYTYQEQVRYLDLHARSDGLSSSQAKTLRDVSPHAPLVAVAAVPPGPGNDVRLAAVEKASAGHAVVLRELGRRHLADGRPDDAVRCLGRAIELSPDGPAYLDLADAHLARGDEDRWKKTLEASLEQEDTGLHHATARVALAERYMATGEYETAEPYALAAAQSYAGWALLCAARCEEGLGKWDEAEQLYRATAGRYENAALEWYFASRLTGKLDPAAAEAAAREFVGSLRRGVPPAEAFGVGRFYLMTGRPKEAREQLARAAESRPTPYGALFAALLADAAGDAAARDKALAKAVAANRGTADAKAVAGTIRVWVGQDGPPDAMTVEGALAGRPPGLRADAEFFAGWLLANRGQGERAKAHWERCVAAAEGTRWLKTHARGFLDGGKP